MGFEEHVDKVHELVATLAEKLEAEHGITRDQNRGKIRIEGFTFPYKVTPEGVIIGTKTIKDLEELPIEYESWIRERLEEYGKV